jgi:hypothetical protein
VFAGLALRARYGNAMHLLQGFAMLGAEIAAPESFPGRRWGMVRTGLRFLRSLPRFLGSRVAPSEVFHPQFTGWSFEERRDGAFHEMHSHRGRSSADFPPASILIRTVGRQAWLRQALASCASQTYPNVQVVVVEDGPATSRAVVEEFAARLDIDYHATEKRVGRSRAGNIAMARARASG